MSFEANMFALYGVKMVRVTLRGSGTCKIGTPAQLEAWFPPSLYLHEEVTLPPPPPPASQEMHRQQDAQLAHLGARLLCTLSK